MYDINYVQGKSLQIIFRFKLLGDWTLSFHLITCMAILLFVVCLNKEWVFQGVQTFWRGRCSLWKPSLTRRWWAKLLNCSNRARVKRLETENGFISSFLSHPHLTCRKISVGYSASHWDDELAMYVPFRVT